MSTQDKMDNETKQDITVVLQNEKYLASITEILPKTLNNLSAKRFVINTLSAITANPKIMECTPLSIKRCVTNAAAMGLIPGTRQCYLIPYGKECTMEVGPDGYKDIAMRSGEIVKLFARTIYNADDFEYNPVTEEIIKHTQDITNMTGEEKDVKGFYAIAVYKDGMQRVKVLSKMQIDKLKAKSKVPNASAWRDSYEGMGQTKAIKSLCNDLPKTIELSLLIENDRDNELSSNSYIDMTPQTTEDIAKTKDQERILKQIEKVKDLDELSNMWSLVEDLDPESDVAKAYMKKKGELEG